MADEQPQLSEMPIPWYRGLSRYHWWVLVIASLGWMFDTMDQQFFNLGRGPAMKQILGFDPIVPGLEMLPPDTPAEMSAEFIQDWVAQGVLSQAQADQVLTDEKGNRKSRVTRKEVAGFLGEESCAPRFIELAENRRFGGGKRWSDFPGESFDRAGLQELVVAEVLSAENADKYLAAYPDGVIPRRDLTVLIGKEIAGILADKAGDDSTFIFVMGWAIGGLFFGWIGDALGRAKTMALTILTYALFTGLNGLANDLVTFNILRFLTALGVGGEFAAGAALVAETMPDRSRPAALGTLQALSAFGNMTAAALAYFILPVSWRYLFLVGALPGLVAVFVFLKLKEPEKWLEARRKWLEEKAAGLSVKRASYIGLLADSRWRGRAIVGLLLGVVGVGGLWGVAFFKPELDRLIVKDFPEETKQKIVSLAFFLQQLGAFFGIWAYTFLSLRMGRRPGFAVFFVLAFVVVSYTFLFADTTQEAFILAPAVGFVTLGPFGGYAIYFPELFPTRLRASGTGFCYNVGRFLAALVPSLKARLKEMFLAGTLALPFLASAVGNAERAIRYGSFVMIFIYIFGLFVLLFAPETKGQPLPED